jgi:hypothetical protein
VTTKNDSNGKPIQIDEGYQPRPERLERGYQPVASEKPDPNLATPTFETGIQRPASTPTQSNPPAQNQDRE